VATDLADAIDALLPQTQCAKCGYAGCRPYAEAIAGGDAEVNRCPPGGQAGVERLAALLQRESLPLDASRGAAHEARVAVIEESLCIGCTLCIQACPVDAIVGAAKFMHTVLLEACTGCELCMPPCPVDCIGMLSVDELAARGFDPVPRDPDAWRESAMAARARFEFRRRRLERDRIEHESRLTRKAEHRLAALRPDDPEGARKRSVIEAALERARARRAAAGEPAA
jgi:electron transport complex protein RnfB